MKKKGWIIGIIIVLVILILAVGVYFVSKKLEQEVALRTEIQEVGEMTKDIQTIDIDELNEKLDTTVTTGDYAIVEKAVKQYLKDTINYSLEIKEILESEKFAEIVTAENYQNDRPDFTESLNFINETRTKLEEADDFFNTMLSEDGVMSYIDGKIDDQYYIDVYREVAIGAEGESAVANDKETIANSINTVIDLLNTEEKIINMLKENNDSWQIQGNQIVFDSNELIDEYNSYVNELN